MRDNAKPPRASGNMPRYLIHIGPHKTGTTYLQRAFHATRPALALRGVDYPDRWGGYGGHHDLAVRLASADDDTLPPVFDAFKRDGATTVLLSSETFSYASEAELRRLRALLAGEPVTLVFYCRRWSELVPSCWQEMVKQGSFRTLPEFALACLQDPWECPTVNFDLVLARYGAVFGADALRIVSFNSVLEAGEDLFSHFCRHFLDWPDPPPPEAGRPNASNDMFDTEIVRGLNALEWTRAREGKQILYHYYMASKDHLPLFWLSKRMKGEVDAILFNDATRGLARLHADVASRYQSALVPPRPDAGLFTPRVKEAWHVRPDYQTSPWVMEMLRAVQAKLLNTAERDAAAG